MQTRPPGDVPEHGAGAEEDGALVLLAREGDAVSFTRLVAKYSGVVRALVRARLRGRADADDVAQDVFLTAWRRLGSLDEPDRFAGWISSIAVNRALEVLRRDDRRRTASLEAAEVDPPDLRADDPSESRLEREEERERMMACLAELDERSQTVIVLRFREGWAVKDIAARLGENPPAVAMRISRAIRKLRARLEPGSGGEGDGR
jgi:RNA polymerase sigma-70 factor (ECF subfamily)